MPPDQYTIQENFLTVGDGHQIYTQEWGNAKAKTTMLFVHGGPGGRSRDRHKGSFNPRQHRVIFFDQRGCGKSLPYGSLEHNTTDNLIDDIVKILEHYKVKRAVLVGNSWGSALSLAFALAHPGKTEALVVSGVFTGSKKEIEWLDRGLFQTFYPDSWEAYLARTPKTYHQNPTAYHTKQVLGEDPDARAASGYAYDTLESGVARLDDHFTPLDPTDYDPLPIRMEMYYMVNGCFMPDRHVLNNAHKLTMPVWLVQGRYDMVCPPQTAYELDKKLPNSHLIWTISGHRAERHSVDVIKTILLHFT